MKYSLKWLQNEIAKGKDFTYFGFWGSYNESDKEKAFSNFYKTPIKAEIEGKSLTFKTSEQYFMYLKAKCFNDDRIAERLLEPNLSGGVFINI